MAKVGRKTKYRKDFHPQSFIDLSKTGQTLAQIALEWNVGRSQLYIWEQKHAEFRDAVKTGREFAEAWYMNLGKAAMTGRATVGGKPIKVELGWFVWLTKNMFKWSDRFEQETEAGKDIILDLNIGHADSNAESKPTE